jgi:hypothetical protein
MVERLLLSIAKLNEVRDLAPSETYYNYVAVENLMQVHGCGGSFKGYLYSAIPQSS